MIERLRLRLVRHHPAAPWDTSSCIHVQGLEPQIYRLTAGFRDRGSQTPGALRVWMPQVMGHGLDGGRQWCEG